MALTPERKVKNAVVAVLQRHGAYHFFPPSNGFGRSGIPDIIVCHNGVFIAIECKAGKGKPTALQQRELHRISEAGGVALLINENNISAVEYHLNRLGPQRDQGPATLSSPRPDQGAARED